MAMCYVFHIILDVLPAVNVYSEAKEVCGWAKTKRKEVETKIILQ